MPQVLGINNGSIEGDTSLEQRKKFWVRRSRDKITYLVLGDTLSDTRWEIEATAGIPLIGEPYLGGICKRLSSKEITRVRHPVTGYACGLWEVDAEWDNNVNEEEEQDPTERTPKISWSSETENVVLEKDQDGRALITGAGEPLFYEVPRVVPVLSVTRYEPYPFDPDVILNYVNHTNSSEFYGAPIGCAYMKDISTEEEVIEGVRYIKASYVIKFKIDKDENGAPQEYGWAAKLLHEGHKYRDSDDTIQVWMSKEGQPATVNLYYPNGTDQIGGYIIPEDNPEGYPEYLVFYPFPETDFNDLNLGPY